MRAIRIIKVVAILSVLAPLVAIAQPIAPADQAPAPIASSAMSSTSPSYLIGPGDNLQIFVWKNPELSTEVPVRPDGKVTTPLIQDMQAQGKTPTQLAADLRAALTGYIQDPVVTVLVKGFAAPANDAAIRVIGAAVTPKTVPYRTGITALDVVIDVGGLTTFADGNGAELLRKVNGSYQSYSLRLADLVKSGNLKANINLAPGDIIRIPERWF